jgi:urease accessory protein
MRRSDDLILPSPTPALPCTARLTLGFADDAGTTRLVERAHFGPLRVQKPLYPEGHDICHTIIVHPPGGVVGGDQLLITADVGAAAGAFITTPGAAKWYKANGHVSRQDVSLTVGADATLEWLPQETIFFDAASVRMSHTVELAKGACYIGAEILCFGRTASGESFTSGCIGQQTSIRLDGKLLWFEQGTLGGGSSAMRSSLGLAGHTVCATLVAVGKVLPATLVASLRELGVGVSQMKNLLVVRMLGDSSEVARQRIHAAWQLIRPALMDRAAPLPRIWQT